MEGTMVVGFEVRLSTDLRREYDADFIDAQIFDEATKAISKKIVESGKSFIGLRWTTLINGVEESYSGAVYVFPYDYREKLGKLALEYGINRADIDEFLYEAMRL